MILAIVPGHLRADDSRFIGMLPFAKFLKTPATVPKEHRLCNSGGLSAVLIFAVPASN